MTPLPDSTASPLEALALAYQQLLSLADDEQWDEIEALSEEIGALCETVQKSGPIDLSNPRLLAASQRIVALQPVLAERFGAQLQELQSLLAAARNTSRINQNYGSSF